MPIGTRKTLAKKAIRARRWRKPPIYVKQLLAWADAHHAETGRWPTSKSGRVRGTLEENWQAIDTALRTGARGLRRGDSLARLLARFRGVRNRKALPPYTIKQILRWVDAYFKRHDSWPLKGAGEIAEAPGETWMAVEMALCHGQRGLAGGLSLARLLAKYRNRRNSGNLPPFTTRRILIWADRWHKQTGVWPTALSGPLPDALGETWLAIDLALKRGLRGMPPGPSLARFLYRHRGVIPQQRRRPPLSIDKILAWADAHHERTGKWPDAKSGRIPQAGKESWGKIQTALRQGERGLRGNQSLAKLLAEHRGVRNHLDLPDFTINKILAWADAHYKRQGKWPSSHGGLIDDAPQETWTAVGQALSRGLRGLPGGSSLARLLAERRSVRNRSDLPKFNAARIVAWADAHHLRTGMWPNHDAGDIAEMPGETWAIVDHALRNGLRGLRGGTSLAKLLQRQRGVVPKQRRKPRLTIDVILSWGDDYLHRQGHWPTCHSGKIPQSPRDSWEAVHIALRDGKRGLPGGLSLGRLWAEYRGARNIHSIPKLSTAQILRWAQAHRRRTGAWPRVKSGPIMESPATAWHSVDAALRTGLRGLRGGSSLKRFLDKYLGNGKPASATSLPPRARSRPLRRRKPAAGR